MFQKLRSVLKTLAMAAFVFAWCPLRNLVRRVLGRCHTTVLLYHRVSDALRDDVTVSVDQFAAQMAFLKKHYDVIDIEKLAAERAKPWRRPRVAITFDDGYADNHDAAKVLQARGLPCTFFVCTQIVGTDNAFPHDREKLGRRVPALSWPQVEEMAAGGFHFAPHTATHADLATLAHDEGVAEIRRSQEDLAKRLGPAAKPHWFAYPRGRAEDIPTSVREALPSFDIDLCFSAYGGVNYPEFDPMNILRQGVDHKFTLLCFRAVVEGWRVRLPKRTLNQKRQQHHDEET